MMGDLDGPGRCDACGSVIVAGQGRVVDTKIGETFHVECFNRWAIAVRVAGAAREARDRDVASGRATD